MVELGRDFFREKNDFKDMLLDKMDGKAGKVPGPGPNAGPAIDAWFRFKYWDSNVLVRI